ncbi:MAG: OmpA family protein [Burkholderiales bacterium]|nr:OmpA family protein [Betaproteobacteria bacterium]
MKLSGRMILSGVATSVLFQVGCTSTVKSPSDSATAPQQTAAAAPAGGGAAQRPGAPTMQANPRAFESASIYFEYDSTVLSDASNAKLRAAVAALSGNRIAVEIQGNADERGSREYNMALGQKRAVAVKKALSALGVNANQIETISFGEDKPKAKGHDETAWAENRRADLVKR